METGSISFTESSSSSPPNSSSQLNGRKVYFQDPNKPADPAGSTPSHRRKTKGAATLSIHGGQTPRCQVEGCKVDLSDAKAYYSRHKVCGTHSKSSLVIVSGIEQRFCQQCSKFHLLSEFDLAKRSCRRRLAGHNERRRKPPSGSLLSLSSSSSRFSHLSGIGAGGGGAFLMDFTAYSSRHLAGHGCSWGAAPTPTGRGHQATGHANVGQCYNTAEADSSCALSLLSNRQQQHLWGSTPGGNYNTTMLLQHQHAAPPCGVTSVVNNHHFQGSSSIRRSIPPGLVCLDQCYYPEGVNLGPEGRRECSELEPLRTFNSSSHQMHWSV